MENTVVILVNLLYDNDETGHVLYQVDASQEQNAIAAAQRAYAAWKNADQTSLSTIEDFIEDELKRAGIQFETLTYEPLDLSM